LQGGGDGASAAADAGRDPDPDDDLQLKVDEYIACMNALSPAIHHARHRYLTHVPRTGPTGRETSADLLPLPSGAASACAAGVARAKRLPPPNDRLEAAGEQFAKTASAFDRLV